MWEPKISPNVDKPKKKNGIHDELIMRVAERQTWRTSYECSRMANMKSSLWS